MMKKNGFTLAEVLITLAIIGVVATMTLPTLMTNTQEAQAKTGLKKGINTLTEAAQLNSALKGFDYASLTATTAISDLGTDLTDVVSLEALLANNTMIDKGQRELISSLGLTTANNATIYFRDGSTLSYIQENTVVGAEGSEVADYQSDGLPLGFTAVLDTNGAKTPNTLSNCQGKAAGADESSEAITAIKDGTALDLADCNDKTKRVIRDQFLVQLRGTAVVPLGKASTWVMTEAKGTQADQ